MGTAGGLETNRSDGAFLPVRHSSVYELPSLVLANSSISSEPIGGFYFPDSPFWSAVERTDPGRSHNVSSGDWTGLSGSGNLSGESSATDNYLY